MIKSLLNNNFIKFLILGGVAALINFVSRIFINFFLSYRFSIILSYFLGMIVAFYLFRKFIFIKSQKPIKKQIYGFVTVNILGIIQVWCVSVFLEEFFFPLISFNFYSKEFAHAIGISVPAITSYFGHKYLSFS